MKRIDNPYNPGAGNPPPALVGRDTELDDVDVAIQRLAKGRHAKSLMLSGLRGVGKTVLLGEFRNLAAKNDWPALQLEAKEGLKFEEAMASLVRKAMMQLSVGERMTKRAKSAFGVLKSFQLRWSLGDGSDITVGVDPTPGKADSGALEDDLSELFVELGRLARDAESGLLITIDEVQYLKVDELGALIVALHQISQEGLPLLVAAAGLPSIPSLAGEAKSYAERLFDFREIGSLDSGSAALALTKPAEDEGISWEPAAVARVVSAAEGYPYFLQEFGKHVWDCSPGPNVIRTEDVEPAVAVAVMELDSGFFRVRVDRSTDAEKRYLVAMASLGAGSQTSGEVAKAMDRNTAQVGPTRDSLIKKGLCYSPRFGLIAFTVPMFDQFIRRHLTD